MESAIIAIIYFAFILTLFCWLVTPIKEIEVINTAKKSEIESSIIDEIESSITDEITKNESTEESLVVPEPTSQELKIEYSKEEILSEKTSEEINLPTLKTYLLHKHRVVKLKDLPNSFKLPKNIKKYNLRGQEVIRISALEALLAI